MSVWAWLLLAPFCVAAWLLLALIWLLVALIRLLVVVPCRGVSRWVRR